MSSIGKQDLLLQDTLDSLSQASTHQGIVLCSAAPRGTQRIIITYITSVLFVLEDVLFWKITRFSVTSVIAIEYWEHIYDLHSTVLMHVMSYFFVVFPENIVWHRWSDLSVAAVKFSQFSRNKVPSNPI